MAIPDSFIDELLARSDIADVVGGYVSLSRKGNSLWGLCPFHSEKTPSFHVVPDRQIYKCFGCGKGGGVINFIMEVENLPYPDAVRLLAQKVGMEVPEVGDSAGMRERRQRLLALNKEAARFFHDTLQASTGRAGAEYLQQRRLSRSTITRFGLGCAPDEWDGLIRAMAERGYQKGDLLDAGLVVQSDNGRIYDRFRNRVMFPIIDLRGEVIGFGGRVLDDSKPKYLNSPDTVIYNKSRNVFALNIARKSQEGRLVLTEGYMDTISLHQAGIDCAVASLGTSLTTEHAQLLAKYTKETVICYDGDGAGLSAAQRAIPILEQAGLKVKVLRMQGAKDPDEYIGKFGADAFRKLLEQSENHIEYRLDSIRQKYHLEDDSQRVEFLKEATGLVASLRSAVEREVYGTRAAESAGISAEAMAQEVKKELTRRIRKENKQQERKDLTPAIQLQPKARSMKYQNIRSARAEEGVLRLMLLEPELFGRIGTLTAEKFSAPILSKVFGMLLERFKTERSTQLAALTGELTQEEMSHLVYVMDQPESLQNSQLALGDYIKVIETEYLKRTGTGSDDALRAAQERYREKKGMEDKA